MESAPDLFPGAAERGQGSGKGQEQNRRMSWPNIAMQRTRLRRAADLGR
jgi:hypothetical protein